MPQKSVSIHFGDLKGVCDAGSGGLCLTQTYSHTVSCVMSGLVSEVAPMALARNPMGKTLMTPVRCMPRWLKSDGSSHTQRFLPRRRSLCNAVCRGGHLRVVLDAD